MRQKLLMQRIMTNYINTFLSVFILTLLISCSGRQSDRNAEKIPETPNALKDDKLDIKSYSRSSSGGSDLTEELYQELVSESPALKKLEDELYAYSPIPNDINEKYQNFDRKSISYYNAANNLALTITDSLLKNKIISLIKSSNNIYKSKTAEINSLLQQVSKNEISIDDHHSVLKIALTIPLIEEYQKNNLPNKKDFKELIQKQKNLILQTDSLTPKY